MKKDPQTKSLYGQELIDAITLAIRSYSLKSPERAIIDKSVKHMARRIFNQDGDQDEMIKYYLEEVKRNLLLNITNYAKSDTSMRSETSEDQEASLPDINTMIEEDMAKTEDFLKKLKGKEKT